MCRSLSLHVLDYLGVAFLICIHREAVVHKLAVLAAAKATGSVADRLRLAYRVIQLADLFADIALGDDLLLVLSSLFFRRVGGRLGIAAGSGLHRRYCAAAGAGFVRSRGAACAEEHSRCTEQNN